MAETHPMHPAMAPNRATRRAATKVQRAIVRAPRHQPQDPLAAFRVLRTARARLSTERLDANQLLDLGIGYHGALAAITSGRGTWDDCNTLALAANVALVLAEAGLGADEVPAVIRAQQAVVQLVQRGTLGGRYALTGAELRELQELLALHDAQLAHEECTEGVMVAALAEIKRRMTDGNVLEGTR